MAVFICFRYFLCFLRLFDIFGTFYLFSIEMSPKMTFAGILLCLVVPGRAWSSCHWPPRGPKKARADPCRPVREVSREKKSRPGKPQKPQKKFTGTPGRPQRRDFFAKTDSDFASFFFTGPRRDVQTRAPRAAPPARGGPGTPWDNANAFQKITKTTKSGRKLKKPVKKEVII